MYIVYLLGSSCRRVLFNRTIVKSMLESRYNLDVTVAIHGQEALEVMASGIQFDLILMDLMMPVMGGYDCFTEKKMKKTIVLYVWMHYQKMI